MTQASWSRCALAITLLLFAGLAEAAGEKTQAPYLSVVGDHIERLPLSSTSVEASIVGVIADVKVKQVYENRGTKPIEAVYVFPASDRAAVQALTMKVGERVIHAKIRTKEAAKAEYAQARSEGKTASLLEQLDPSVFRMNVANILPGDRVEVELRYTEMLVPDAGIYEFFFPNTMGQPYGNSGEAGVSNPKSDAAEVVDFAFDIHVHVATGMPLVQVDSPSHKVEVKKESANAADITLGDSAIQKAGAQDFVLHYSLGGARIESGILAYPEGDGGYFLLMAQPPGSIPDESIAPREFIFVIDVSGSMIGAPLDLAKQLASDLFSVLRPTDLVNVEVFSGGSRVLAPKGSLHATPDTLKQVRAAISDQDAGGGTELVPALDIAYALPTTPGYARSVIVITDGEISAGAEAFRTVRKHLGESNLFAFGVGPTVSRPVISLLARAGAGEPFIVDSMKDGTAVAAKLRRYIDRPLLTHIQLDTDTFDVSDLEPEVLPDLLAERPIVVVGRYRGKAEGGLRIRGISGTQPYNEEVRVDPAAVSTNFNALRQLWARTRIQRLQDEQASEYWGGGDWTNKNEAAITQLGLSYELLTPYTSFVAVDDRVRTDTTAEKVEQPAVAKPTASYSRGTGNYTGLYRHRATRAPSAPPPPPKSTAPTTKDLDNRHFSLIDGCWTDAKFVAGMHTLRIRRDSEAFRRLLALAPELAATLALGDRVIVVVNGTALQIGPDGFSTYSEAVLRRALNGRG